MILGLVDTVLAKLFKHINRILIAIVLSFTRLIIKANVLVARCTTPANVFLEHLDVLIKFFKDGFVNLLHQKDANSLHILVGKELFIVLINNRENLLGKEVKALAQTGTQTVLFAPHIFVVVYVFDRVKLLLFSPGFKDCVEVFTQGA